jgi:hypothetical protein
MFAMLAVFSSCEKNPALSDAPFDFSFVRISGNDESSFNVSFKSQANASINDVYQDDSGSYLITGVFLSSLRTASNELFLLKLSPLGDLIWSKKFEDFSYLSSPEFLSQGSQSYTIIGKVAKNEAANGYINTALILEFNLDGDLTSNTFINNNDLNPSIYSADDAGSYITFAAETDISGASLNEIKRINRITGALEWEVSTTFQVNALAATINNEELALGVNISQVNGFPEWYIQKFSSTGDSLWFKNIDNASTSSMTISEIIPVENGDFILPIRRGLPSTNDEIRKYDSSGNLVWSHTVNNKLVPGDASLLNQYCFYLSYENENNISLNKLDLQSGVNLWTKPLSGAMNYRWKIQATADQGVLLLISGFDSMLNSLFKYDSMGN